jgi:hypothetical protein
MECKLVKEKASTPLSLPPATMPRKTNPSKVASAMKRTDDAISAAEDGKFEVGRVEKKLGHGGFLVRYGLGKDDTCQVSITGKVLKGGKASDFYANIGDYVVYDGAEVQGIVTTRSPDLFKRLKRAGRVPTLPDLESDGRVVDVGDDSGFVFEEAEEDNAAARQSYLGGLEGARNLADADAMIRSARVAASRLNAYKNRRATRDERVAAALSEDPEVAAERELMAEYRAAQSAYDRERARAAATSSAVGGAGLVDAELEPEFSLPTAIAANWEEIA